MGALYASASLLWPIGHLSFGCLHGIGKLPSAILTHPAMCAFVRMLDSLLFIQVLGKGKYKAATLFMFAHVGQARIVVGLHA